jgi:hypothetical protein
VAPIGPPFRLRHGRINNTIHGTIDECPEATIFLALRSSFPHAGCRLYSRLGDRFLSEVLAKMKSPEGFVEKEAMQAVRT